MTAKSIAQSRTDLPFACRPCPGPHWQAYWHIPYPTGPYAAVELAPGPNGTAQGLLARHFPPNDPEYHHTTLTAAQAAQLAASLDRLVALPTASPTYQDLHAQVVAHFVPQKDVREETQMTQDKPTTISKRTRRPGP